VNELLEEGTDENLVKGVTLAGITVVLVGLNTTVPVPSASKSGTSLLANDGAPEEFVKRLQKRMLSGSRNSKLRMKTRKQVKNCEKCALLRKFLPDKIVMADLFTGSTVFAAITNGRHSCFDECQLRARRVAEQIGMTFLFLFKAPRTVSCSSRQPYWQLKFDSSNFILPLPFLPIRKLGLHSHFEGCEGDRSLLHSGRGATGQEACLCSGEREGGVRACAGGSAWEGREEGGRVKE